MFRPTLHRSTADYGRACRQGSCCDPDAAKWPYFSLGLHRLVCTECFEGTANASPRLPHPGLICVLTMTRVSARRSPGPLEGSRRGDSFLQPLSALGTKSRMISPCAHSCEVAPPRFNLDCLDYLRPVLPDSPSHAHGASHRADVDRWG